MTRRGMAMAALGSMALMTPHARPQHSSGVASPVPSGTANHYLNAAVCETCHADIAGRFRQTGMGRSFYRLQPANVVERFNADKPFYHLASGTYLTMTERAGKYYQRRWQNGLNGEETNVDEKQVDFVMGSGNHGRTYLSLTSRNTLQQLPLGWYSERGGYFAMSPGFDVPDYPGSIRPVTYECMFCHNAYPKTPAGHEEAGSDPAFLQPLPEGIDCQRCHGPGERHVLAANRKGAPGAEIRAAIVNPKRLSADREMEVCLQCHLETTAAALPHDILRVGRAPFSYVPGQPLGDFRLTFDRAGGMGDRFEIAHAAYRLRDSQCFLRSEGKLRCTTCHDPHSIPRGEDAMAHYNGICQSCHAAMTNRAGADANHLAAANCIGCHMPKRRAEDAVYFVMTDHLIQAHQPTGDLTAPKAEVAEPTYRGKVVPYYPTKIGPTEEEAAFYLAVAQVRDSSNLREGLPMLERLIGKYHPRRADYYVDLAQGLANAGERVKALQYFEQAARLAPDSAIVLRKLGNARMESGQPVNAEATLRRVTALAPGGAAAWGMLGQVLWQQNKNAEAKAAFAKGILADPELPALRGSYGSMLFATGDLAGAGKEFREANRLQPGVARMRMNLASVLAAADEIPEARYYFEESIRLRPEFAEARLNYARLLASHGEPEEAEKHLHAAVAAEPQLAAAHQLLGELLGGRGDLPGALRELQTAVRIQPGFGRAEFSMGVVLGRMRDYAAAAEHLRIAAQGTDQDAKASAQQLLRQMGQ